MGVLVHRGIQLFDLLLILSNKEPSHHVKYFPAIRLKQHRCSHFDHTFTECLVIEGDAASVEERRAVPNNIDEVLHVFYCFLAIQLQLGVVINLAVEVYRIYCNTDLFELFLVDLYE